MNFYSIWPVFIALALLLALIGTPAFKHVAPPIPAANRVETLDGLRGFAALAVFFHHAAIYHYWLNTGSWYFNGSRFYENLGQLGVGMFFMLTGFLFWGQILERHGKPNWIKLYIGRAFRILPLAWVTAFLVLIGVAVSSRLTLREPVERVLTEALSWLSSGFSDPDVNKVRDTWEFIFGVTWTLQYEWLFYFSLPVLALFSRSKRVAAAMLTVLLIGLWERLIAAPNLGQAQPEVICALFAAGMLTATITRLAPNMKIGQSAGSVLVIVFVGVALMLFKGENQSLPLIFMAAAFFLIASGISVFGLLTSTPAKRLGDISFGVYLLQGVVVNSLFYFPALARIEQESPAGHWALMIMAAAVLLVTASLAHLLIERPGIEMGKTVYRRLTNRLVRQAQREVIALMEQNERSGG